VPYFISYLIRKCVHFNYLQPIFYHITLHNAIFLATSLLRYYFRNVAHLFVVGVRIMQIASVSTYTSDL